MHVLVTGANRGIGLALVKRFLAEGHHVHATARRPDEATELRALASPKLAVHALDVQSDASIRELGQGFRGPLDRLVNNAGVASPWESLDGFESGMAADVLRTNSIAPVLVTKALLPALRSASGARVFHISSRMGSIGENSMGGAYAYRMSKAALNMASSCLAIELKPYGIASIVLHPGWVRTDMGGPSATLGIDEASDPLFAQLGRLGLAETGGFFSFDGSPIGW